MSPRIRPPLPGLRVRLASLAVVAATALAVVLAPAATAAAVGTTPPSAVAEARPVATPTFATWSSESVGALGSANIGVAYDGPDSGFPSNLNLTEPSFDPPGSVNEEGLEYVNRGGSITFTFDSPVTNPAIYTYYFRTPASLGPEGYRFDTDGEGSWVRVSGNGLVSGSELVPTDDDEYILNIMAFSGTITTLTIETLGACVDCSSLQGLAIATFDTIPAPAPSITEVSPDGGPASGGTVITVDGEGFFGVTSVTVGGAACTAVEVIDEQTLTCAVPTGAAGAADVVVTALGGTANAAGAFTYTGAPAPPAPPAPAPAPVTPAFTG